MKKSEKTERTVRRILEAAVEEFGKNGYAAGTVNNICKTGINKGLIYHNFTGKDDLYLNALQYSCEKFLEYIQEDGKETNLQKYLELRIRFSRVFHREAQVLFGALLDPPLHLTKEIREILMEFNQLSQRIYRELLDTLVLRKGISIDAAMDYFSFMQTMLNTYFGSSEFETVMWEKKIELHETILPRLVDYMLYGIAKGETEND